MFLQLFVSAVPRDFIDLTRPHILVPDRLSSRVVNAEFSSSGADRLALDDEIDQLRPAYVAYVIVETLVTDPSHILFLWDNLCLCHYLSFTSFHSELEMAYVRIRCGSDFLLYYGFLVTLI